MTAGVMRSLGAAVLAGGFAWILRVLFGVLTRSPAFTDPLGLTAAITVHASVMLLGTYVVGRYARAR